MALDLGLVQSFDGPGGGAAGRGIATAPGADLPAQWLIKPFSVLENLEKKHHLVI